MRQKWLSINDYTKKSKAILLSLSIFLGSIIIILIYFFIFLQPSNYREWEKGFEILPNFSISGNQVSIQNLRNTTYDINNQPNIGYLNTTFDTNKITKVWFVFEPFTVKPFTGFKGVAHTYFIFDFVDHEPIAISVEARREIGEKYNAWKGLFNQYELTYIWSTEQDETIKRVAIEHNRLYMYPLTISNSSAQKLLLQLAQSSQDLFTTPRFYNSISSNCTNELAKAANRVKPGSIPFSMALYFPGFSIKELYKLGYLPKEIPVENLQKKYNISQTVEKIAHDPDFSKKLRQSFE
jgi:hypothetical protein